MDKKVIKDVVWPIRMSQTLKDEFKKHCDEQGFSMNKRMKILIQRDIDGK